MRTIFPLMLTLSLLTLSGNVLADCLLDGQKYAEGSVVGQYVCKGGKWVDR